MQTTHLSAFIGDSTTLEIPLAWEGDAFDPGSDWALIFTAKKKSSDPDTLALIQKASGFGIESSSGLALVALVPADTADMQGRNLVCDVQAQHTTTGAVRTVAYARLSLLRDITRETEVSIPIITTEEPSPILGAVRYDASQSLTSGQKQQARTNIGVEVFTGTYSPLSRNALTFTGIGTVGGIPTPDPTVTNTGTFLNGKPRWSNTLAGQEVACDYNGTAWEFKVGGVTYASKTSSAETPAGLAGWSLDPSASAPTVTGGTLILSTTGLAIGQAYRQGTSSPYSWWHWTGGEWEPLVSAGRIVSYNTTQNIWQRLTITGAAGEEIISISSF